MKAYNSGTKRHREMVFAYDIGRTEGKNLVRSNLGLAQRGPQVTPKKWSKNRFLSSATDTRVARGLIFGYVVDLKLALNSYFVNIGIGPNRDAQDPKKGFKKIVWLWFLFNFSPSVAPVR